MNYLDRLPFTSEEVDRLRQLDAPSAVALLGMIHASPDAFAHFFGSQQTIRLVEWLESSIGSNESERLRLPIRGHPIQSVAFSTGPAPPLLPQRYDIGERDELFGQLQRLQSDPHPSNRTREAIADLQSRLNAMLD